MKVKSIKEITVDKLLVLKMMCSTLYKLREFINLDKKCMVCYSYLNCRFLQQANNSRREKWQLVSF